jgi:DNA-binding transcriptional ArsR family regulator
VPDRLSSVYGALADPTRRGILERLSRGQCTVAELREPLAMSAPAVSKHLRVLESVGLIERRPVGRHRVCALRRAPLAEAGRWCQEQAAFWSGSLDSLAEYLARDPR